jgi:hypothetical protein
MEMVYAVVLGYLGYLMNQHGVWARTTVVRRAWRG